MKKARWIIQDNLIAENDKNQFQKACDNLGIAHYEVKVVPFSEELPEFPVDDEHENIYYGSTSFINNVYKNFSSPIGVFYNHETFSIENYIDKWGEHMLNCDGEIITVAEFIDRDEDFPTPMFLRPDGDGKEFDGQVGDENELRNMLRRMLNYESPLTLDSKLYLGPAYNIHREWRNYIINGKVITSSRYRSNFRLSKSADDIPGDMIAFVEERCKEYQPHDVFAMDIAETRHDDGEIRYYIIECGCMNSVGFYHADINKYVDSITSYVANKSLTVGA